MYKMCNKVKVRKVMQSTIEEIMTYITIEETDDIDMLVYMT